MKRETSHKKTRDDSDQKTVAVDSYSPLGKEELDGDNREGVQDRIPTQHYHQLDAFRGSHSQFVRCKTAEFAKVIYESHEVVRPGAGRKCSHVTPPPTYYTVVPRADVAPIATSSCTILVSYLALGIQRVS